MLGWHSKCRALENTKVTELIVAYLGEYIM